LGKNKIKKKKKIDLHPSHKIRAEVNPAHLWEVAHPTTHFHKVHHRDILTIVVCLNGAARGACISVPKKHNEDFDVLVCTPFRQKTLMQKKKVKKMSKKCIKTCYRKKKC